MGVKDQNYVGSLPASLMPSVSIGYYSHIVRPGCFQKVAALHTTGSPSC